jgi:hypothetical protein
MYKASLGCVTTACSVSSSVVPPLLVLLTPCKPEHVMRMEVVMLCRALPPHGCQHGGAG